MSRILFLILLAFSEEIRLVCSFCDVFPLGHLCRTMDLTGFCMQTSHLIRIRNKEKTIKPYIQLEKIFDKLENLVEANKPYVHFGGYKRPKWTGDKNGLRLDPRTCIDPDDCIPKPPPGEPTTTSTPPPAAAGGNTSLPGQAPPEPKYCKDINCALPGMLHGAVKAPPGTPTPSGPVPDVMCPDKCRCCHLQPPDDEANGTIYSLQDGCELKYLKSAVKKGTENLITIAADQEAKENPYHLELTEISVNNVRLHNWLHVRIFHNATDKTFSAPSGDLGKGRIKMAFIMAHDALGYPVGEFVNNVPCEYTCHCDSQNTIHEQVCYQGKPGDTFPCMFDGVRVVSNTGMMLVHSDDEGTDQGFKEIHATWRYSQSRHPKNFHTELHFHALLVDDFSILTMPKPGGETGAPSTATPPIGRISAMSERWVSKKGVFGWNPMYTILHPTKNTVGAYDYFREDVFDGWQIDCHRPISAEHYIIEPYPTSGPKIRNIPTTSTTVSSQEHCYRLNNTFLGTPLENAAQCGPQGGTPVKRNSVRCPEIRSRVKPWFHDAYGFTHEGKIDPNQTYPWTLYGARVEGYVIRDGALEQDHWKNYDPEGAARKAGLYFGIDPISDNMDYAECAGIKTRRYGMTHDEQYPTDAENYEILHYGHFCAATGQGRRVLNLPGPPDTWPNPLVELWKAPAVDGESYFADRCYCPTLPGTPDPRYKEPPPVQVQGRRQHAYQMIIAWNCIVPFGFFVSRYYKETYSKVFFLQEFWWYTTHVLCMVSAAMFTFGGIYVIELKRTDPINWLDPNITVHICIGYVIIAMFGFQVFSGFLRVRDAKKRLCNIFMHWCFGVMEYIMAAASMIHTAWIVLSGMTCAGVITLSFLLVFQILFYASMEVHMRVVDKQLKLKPPRSYLPPPVMRVFHKDAPDSKFRVYVLLAYLCLCLSSSIIQFAAMETNKNGESCFMKSAKYKDLIAYEKEEGTEGE